jgi:hypothetical protein
MKMVHFVREMNLPAPIMHYPVIAFIVTTALYLPKLPAKPVSTALPSAMV